jgi:hypothetical protein
MRTSAAVVIGAAVGIVLGAAFGAWLTYAKYRVAEYKLGMTGQYLNAVQFLRPLETDARLLAAADDGTGLHHAMLGQAGADVISAACTKTVYTPSQMLRLRRALAAIARNVENDAWWQHHFAHDTGPIFAALPDLQSAPSGRDFAVCADSFKPMQVRTVQQTAASTVPQ